MTTIMNRRDVFVGSLYFRKQETRVSLDNVLDVAEDVHHMTLLEEEEAVRLRGEQDVFRKFTGVYLKYTIEPGDEQGDQEITHVLLKGKTFPADQCPQLAALGYANRPFFVSHVVVGGDGRVTYYMTPDRAINLEAAIGWKSNSDKRTSVNKRNRRAWATGKLTIEGNIVATEESTWNCRFFDGVMHEIPMTIYFVEFNEAVSWSTVQPVNGTYTAMIGVLNLDSKNPVHQKLVALTDGAHLIDTKRFVAGLESMGIAGAYPAVRMGDGSQFTFGFDKGQAKGNSVFCKLAGLDMLCCDTKTEFIRTGGKARLTLNPIKRPRLVRGDIQSYINAHFEEIGIYGVAAEYWLKKVYRAFGDDDTMRELLGMVLDEECETWDGEEAQADSTENNWVIRTFLKLTKQDLLDANGTPLSVLDFPGLARRIYRHLTEQFADISRFRIPLPQSWAVAQYATFDITVLGAGDKELNGRGFYFDNGRLAAHHVSARKVTKNELGFDIIEPVLGEMVIQRQPNGTGLEWFRGLQGQADSFYDKLRSSPFFFLSVKPFDITDHVAYFEHTIGKKTLQKLIDLWGYQIPTIVLVHATMGGGDNDDRVIAYHDPKIVNHLNNLMDRLWNYPQIDINLDEEGKKPLLDTNDPEIQSLLRTRMSKVAMSRPADLKLVQDTKGGMIGSLSTAAFFLNYLFYSGHELTETQKELAGYCRILETVVDFEKMGKGGNVVNDAREAINKFYSELVEVPDFLVGRLPKRVNENRRNDGLPEVGGFDTATGKEWARLTQLQVKMKEAFDLAYDTRDPRTERVIDFLHGFRVSDEAHSFAKQLRKMWNVTVRATQEQLLSGKLDAITGLEKAESNRVMAEVHVRANKAADEACCQLLGISADVPFTPFQKEVAVALYKHIVSRRSRNPKGGYFQISDGQLFAQQFSELWAEAISWAYVEYRKPVQEGESNIPVSSDSEVVFDTL